MDEKTFIERRNYIMNEIAGTYIRSFENVSSVSSLNAYNYINLKCQDNNKDCYNCLLNVIKNENPNDTNPEKLLELMKPQERLRITSEVCGGVCECSLTNVKNITDIMLNITKEIDEGKIKKMAEKIEENISKELGPSSSKQTENIKSILVSINTNVQNNIEQLVNSIKIIELKGSGYKIDSINQTDVINAVMTALQQVCSEGDKCGITVLNSIVESQMQYIRDEVDKNVKGSFTKMFGKAKNYLIFMGLFIALLVITYIVLLVRKAMISK